MKLSLKGRFDYLPHPLVYYRIHDNNMSRDVNLILHESLEIVRLYKDEIIKRKIDIDKIIGSIYGSIVIILYNQNKKIKARFNQKHYFPKYTTDYIFLIGVKLSNEYILYRAHIVIITYLLNYLNIYKYFFFKKNR